MIFDHQMAIDPVKRVLYCFGGKRVHRGDGSHEYSGLYLYDLDTGSWRLVLYAVNIVSSVRL